MLQKKILISALFAGLATLGVSMSANAALPGPYVGGTIGWGDTGYANEFDGNYSWTNPVTSQTFTNHVSVDDKGLAGGGNVGYQFNSNFAVEGGFTQFSNTKVKITIPGIGIATNSIRENTFDLAGKGILPLGNGFSLYGKLGAAYVNANNLGYGNDRVAPLGSVGLSYDITPNLPIDVGYTRIQRVWSDNTSPIQSINYVGVGLTYHFG